MSDETEVKAPETDTGDSRLAILLAMAMFVLVVDTVQGVPLRRHRSDAPTDRAGRRDDRPADLSADGARIQRHAGRTVPRPPAEQQQIARALEDNAEVMTNTHLDTLLSGQPAPIKDEIIRINTEARPLALQIALLIPILAGLIGVLTSFRMGRLPDPAPSGPSDGVVLG